MTSIYKLFLLNRVWIVLCIIIIINILYFLIFFGVYFFSKQYMYVFAVILHCIIFLYLALRFNILNSKSIVISYDEKQIVFCITFLILFNTIFYDLDVVRFIPTSWKSYTDKVHQSLLFSK